MIPFRALLRFCVVQQLRSLQAALALAVFAGLFFFAGGARGDTRASFLLASLAATALVINFGIARDRRAGFDRLAVNFVSPFRLLAAKALAAAAIFALLCALMLAVAALAWSDLQLALWYLARTVLFIALAIPLALLLESLVVTEFPAVFAAALLAVVMAGLTLQGKGVAVVAFLGLETTRGSFASLDRVLYVNVTWNLIPLAVALAVWHWRQPRQRGTWR